MNTENTERGSAARSEFVDTGEAENTQRDRAYGALYSALLQAYPEHLGISSDSECRAIFYHLLDTGHDEDKIIDGAFDYADQCREIAPQNVRPLIYYLRVKGWQEENHHLLQPVQNGRTSHPS